MGDRSVSAQDISQSVVVTGDGNNVALSFGATGIRLPLRRKQFLPPDRRSRPREGEPPRELDLLVAEARKFPFVPRLDIFAELQAWLANNIDLSVHALIGRAGTGKTRLALEFCGTIDYDPSASGEWIAGFLSPTDLNALIETLTTRSFKWDRPTLLVIDYAAQSHRALARWLDRLADQQLGAKLRFLLLEREAPQDFGWWHELTALGPPARRDLFYTLRPRQLPDLADLEERRALMAMVLQAARELSPGTWGGDGGPGKKRRPRFRPPPRANPIRQSTKPRDGRPDRARPRSPSRTRVASEKPTHYALAGGLLPLGRVWVFNRIGEILHEADQRFRGLVGKYLIRAAHSFGGFGLARRFACEGFDDCGFADQIGLDCREVGLLRRSGRREFLLQQHQ